MSRITPAALEGNAVQTSLLARVLGRRPEILTAFGRLDAATRFHGELSPALKEAVRRATAGEVGCEYCQSLGEYRPNPDDARESLAVAFARLIADDPTQISDAQFDVLREEFSEEEIVELVAFVCFVAIAGQLFGATMALGPADPEEAAAYQAVVGSR
ncbi:carboxymuconolactone decarboxylase family protein [Baekduia soli]|uniref:Carboxymuconolactone decarboxylase family protein n=1 Tax=Baekduia soli TaxID=496014 RepID=A0A5B8UBL3_9ACTN|nr:carboxymuconolactone decarboxylase family protein [Baekduia soli]QEC50546.1 carboxymuconolactone decarboxylase family protein [Baekduia soli]